MIIFTQCKMANAVPIVFFCHVCERFWSIIEMRIFFAVLSVTVDMKKALSEIGVNNIVIRRRDTIGINPIRKRRMEQMADRNCKNHIICRRADEQLSESQLKEIADLIYDSDLYIYPAMFESRQQAETIIPRMICAGDQMFKRDNIYVAMDGIKIVGVLIWMRGPLQWNKKIYEKCGGRSEYIDRIIPEYFNLFEEAPSNMNTVVRISVKKERQRNRIGTLLMQTVMEAEQGPYQLFVLSDNAGAISFFQGNGFSIREIRPGFSLDYEVPPCFWMIKEQG